MANFKTYLFTVFAILASLAACLTAGAQPRERREFAIHYRFDKIDIDSAYLDNAATIDTIRFYLTNSAHIDSITVYAWASPEGGYPHNKWLSEKRAAAAKELLLELAPDSTKLNEGKIKISPLAENWPGLTELVEKNYHRQDRDRLLRILRTEGIGEETRKWRIKQLDNGYTWEYLKRNYMKQLRSATWLCVWTSVGAIEPLQEIRDTLRAPQSGLGRTVEAVAAENLQKSAIFALHTNLLMPALNLGAEYALSENWTLTADYYYPWFWPKKQNKDCFELLGWAVGTRYYFGSDRTVYDNFRGHSLGLYIIGGYYDFERNYSGIQGQFVGPGLEYKYSFPLGRKQLVNLDLSFAVGYIYSWGTPYKVPYENGPLYPEDYSIRNHYFGPTRLCVGLTFPLYNRKEVRR